MRRIPVLNEKKITCQSVFLAHLSFFPSILPIVPLLSPPSPLLSPSVSYIPCLFFYLLNFTILSIKLVGLFRFTQIDEYRLKDF